MCLSNFQVIVDIPYAAGEALFFGHLFGGPIAVGRAKNSISPQMGDDCRA
jgi:hypothetical protein